MAFNEKTQAPQGRPNTNAFLQPVDSCCCGQSLDSGIKVVITLHSLVCFAYVFSCVSNIVLEFPTLGSGTTLATQSFNCAWGLASIPFICFGISGVRYHLETHLRIYMYWLTFTVFLDIVLAGIYIAKTSCSRMPNFLVLEGGAFACGFMRIFGIFFMVMVISFSLYGVYVVWSRCEELQDSGSEPGFDALIEGTMANKKRHIFEHKSGLFGTGPILSRPHPIMYNSLASPPFAGSARLFSGREHVTEFPPPPMHSFKLHQSRW